MRIVIDMQGAQTESRFRGVGRYTLSLTKAIIHNRGEYEIILALNGLFPDTIEHICAEFDDIIPQENIRVCYALGPVRECENGNEHRREVAENIREAFLSSLNPDVVLVSSLFEGLNDNAITSIGTLSNVIPTAVILYDLIPLIHPHPYLDNPVVEKWYKNKLDYLSRSDLLLSISESSQREGINHLGFSSENCVNISAAVDSQFKPIQVNNESEIEVRKRYGLLKPFVMYTGGIDHRKNIEGLIRAYAMLPKSLRDNHQLAIVCSIQPASRVALEKLAKKNGLRPDELVLTGFISEKDLLILYNLCKAFVFPSWLEGFGLPALEAMSCGKAVIGANTSSLPEVIGLDEALFDPNDDQSISSKIEQVLSDEHFRVRLEKYGLEQAKKFSWDKSACKAILAIEKLVSQNNKLVDLTIDNKKLPRLAYISPLPPVRSGISDYSAELLPELSKYYQIDVIVSQSDVSNEWIKNNCNIKTVEWFKNNSSLYDRVLYHFGNSEFHKYMFSLLEEIPGVVVLHDFFLSSIIAHMDVTGYRSGYWAEALYKSHGYKAVYDRYHAKDTVDVVWKYPVNLPVLQDAKSIIVHSENSIRLDQEWYGDKAKEKFSVIPLLRVPAENIQYEQARKMLGLPTKAFLVCSFGILGPTKLNHRLLSAFLKSSLSMDSNCFLIFVGENDEGSYGNELLSTIKNCKAKGRIKITDWVNMETFHYYLESADIGVQLRTFSRGETSAAVLDCMNYGISTIVNENGPMADLSKDAVLMIPDDFTDAELISVLESLYRNQQQRTETGEKAKEIIKAKHNPAVCAKQYFEVIEKAYAEDIILLPALINKIALNKELNLRKSELVELSNCLDKNFPLKPNIKQIFLDISELVQRDSKTGIQRVVRSLLKELIDNQPYGYHIEPVYATINQGYRYARNFTLQFLFCPESILSDEPIEFRSGDIFLGLDLQPHVVSAQKKFYQQLRNRGVQVQFLVYDLLPIILPNAFPKEADKFHRSWLNVIVESDGVICISKAVSDELKEWYKNNQDINSLRPFKINWFHLGADVENSIPSLGLSNNAENILKELSFRPTFLTVGTLEPRKRHAQILSAFELLWNHDIDINLVIVGKQGWMVESLVKRLRQHPERNKHLFWLEGISDEYLEKIYSVSTCLIAASEGEGFGLPLIEAARHKLPIIARDIPVFREVACEYAFYFKGLEPKDLSVSINDWLKLNAKGKAPQSTNIPWLTWRQSTQQLLKVILPEVNYSDSGKIHQINIINKYDNKEKNFRKSRPQSYFRKLVNLCIIRAANSRFRKPLKKIYYALKLDRFRL